MEPPTEETVGFPLFPPMLALTVENYAVVLRGAAAPHHVCRLFINTVSPLIVSIIVGLVSLDF